MLIFRDAEADDLPFIVGLSIASAVGSAPDAGQDWSGPGYRAALAAITADPNQRLVIVERDGARVGTLQLSFIPGVLRGGMWRLLLESVHVVPEARSQGIGARMIGWAMDEARARGCGLVQLTSNKARLDAHRFYRRLGFEQSHEGFKFWL
ncbi:Acetyltransferase (GNAT) family protein [Devosia enhydra]|uniref:Acetyltransferase (GNAT) family protein n=1 Tax=Devosia enhydra TaxID=665118 RepID=A0A1K2HV13_9HYPH|nr:GNAT family N-acetyltransferase [Devosia enhydra]SFZ82263.1 Acetyltransferase (GNAT) family protein [Devosia enhydra]